MSQGLFITLEGGEGSGKSTQIARLAESLKAAGHDVVVTREPGGTPEAEKIRNFLVQRDGGNWTPMAEALLLYAAREMHVEHLIKPALAQGKVVISDRFADSSRAYQAYGHGLGIEKIDELNALVLGNFKPDITFILDIDVKTGLVRAGKRLTQDQSSEDRFEKMGSNFHERLRQGYLEIAKREPDRCIVVDAAQSVDEIASELRNFVFRKIK